MSDDSSGWNVRAIRLAVLTPTTSPPRVALTLPSGPVCVNLGARMNTPGNSRPSSNASRGAWNESVWEPNEYLSIYA